MIFLDDITVFSSSNLQHIDHLKKISLKCRKFSISLNPQNSHFYMPLGKLLGHIISKDGNKIDPSRVETI